MAIERIYMLAYDGFDTEIEPEHVKSAIRANERITNWWHHLPSIYLVTTEMSANELADQLRSSLNDTSFLVIEVDLTNAQGWLPEPAWSWIKKRTRAEAMTG